jgi:hypothetical protein
MSGLIHILDLEKIRHETDRIRHCRCSPCLLGAMASSSRLYEAERMAIRSSSSVSI